LQGQQKKKNNKKKKNDENNLITHLTITTNYYSTNGFGNPKQR
jgi:hypothetical protein